MKTTKTQAQLITTNPASDATDARPRSMTLATTDLSKGPTAMITKPIAPEATVSNNECACGGDHGTASVEEMQKAQREAWEQTRAERESITKEQLGPTNFNSGVAVPAMRRAYRRVLPLRAQLVAGVSGFDVRLLDNLLTYAEAMAYGDERVIALDALAPAPGVTSEADELTGRLLRALVPLADEGFFPKQLLDEVSSKEGRANRAKCLSRIVTAVLDLWPQLAGRTTITGEMLARGRALSDALYDKRSFRGETVDPTTAELERLQSMTLAYRSYEEVRRAVAWLRWYEDDATKIAPSIHRNEFQRARRSGSASDTGATGENTKGDADAKKPTGEKGDTNGDGKNGDGKSGDAQKPALPAKPVESSLFARPKPGDDVIKYGANGLPLVPQDDPFAKD